MRSRMLLDVPLAATAACQENTPTGPGATTVSGMATPPAGTLTPRPAITALTATGLPAPLMNNIPPSLKAEGS